MLHPVESKKLNPNCVIHLLKYYLERYKLSEHFRALVEPEVIKKVSKIYL